MQSQSETTRIVLYILLFQTAIQGSRTGPIILTYQAVHYDHS